VAASALETFSQTGFNEALIQRKGSDNDHFNCAWSVFIVRGFILAALMSLFSDNIAALFKIPHTGDISKVLALSFILQSFTNIGIVKLLKELRFKRYYAFTTITALGDFIISIMRRLSCIMHGPWLWACWHGML